METPFTAAQIRDLNILVTFVDVFCRSRHGTEKHRITDLPDGMDRRLREGLYLCPACAEVVRHGIQKRMKCPLNPKPSCKKCTIHCYSNEYRSTIREIMAFSGKRMIMRGRLDYLWHYLF